MKMVKLTINPECANKACEKMNENKVYTVISNKRMKGLCHRYPAGTYSDDHPSVNPNDWCGEYHN